jgi:hypothetical protein
VIGNKIHNEQRQSTVERCVLEPQGLGIANFKVRASRLGILLRVDDKSFRGINAYDLACGHFRFHHCGNRPGPGAHVEYSVAILDAGKRDVGGREQAAPAAHEALVTSTRCEHLCFGFCHVGGLGKSVLAKDRCDCQRQQDYACEFLHLRLPQTDQKKRVISHFDRAGGSFAQTKIVLQLGATHLDCLGTNPNNKFELRRKAADTFKLPKALVNFVPRL